MLVYFAVRVCVCVCVHVCVLSRDPTTRKALILYLTFSFAVIGYEEMFSVFAKTDPTLGK